jgi:hypothetical protein
MDCRCRRAHQQPMRSRGQLSRNPEYDVDARGPTSCRRSRLRAHQESGNRCALTTAPTWTLTLNLSSVTPPYSRCRTAADITACLGDPGGNCGSPIGVARGHRPCGGRKCGVDLLVENVDRPRPDQRRRSVLPAGVPSTSSTGHPRGACRDKAQRRGPASGHDSRVLDAETQRHGALCTPGNPITCAVRTSPQAPRGGVHSSFSQRHATPVFHRGALGSGGNPASTAGPGRPPDTAAVVDDRRIDRSLGGGVRGWQGGRCGGVESPRRSRNTCRSSPKYLPVSPTHSMPLRCTVDAALASSGRELPCTVPKPRCDGFDLQVRPPVGLARIMPWPHTCST